MAYNKQYNTRFPGRYNTPGQFVSAAETIPEQPPQMAPAPQPPKPQKENPNLQKIETKDEMETDAAGKAEDGSERPHWMKSKLAGVKKLSNKERRRRQNENLRRLLSPKNALMVLNEMMPHEQLFRVEPATSNQFYKSPGAQSFCADLNIDGNNYKGYGDNKMMARNSAAEQAIRDIIIKKMFKAVGSDAGSTDGGETEEEALPMIQLASFALHKLFAEWEYEGHKVPQLRAPAGSTTAADGATGRPAETATRRELPVGASSMHPCMLLTYMRPHLEYRELASEGDRPQNMLFTMGVDVDGTTYIGKASNKKEARKLAAKSACQTIFGVQFETPAQ